MKTIVKLALVVSIMLMTTVGMANVPGLKLLPDNDLKSVVFEFNTQGKDAHLTLKDWKGQVLFSENIVKKDVYRKKFDMSELKEGKYTLTVENSLFEISNAITIGKEGIIVSEETKSSKPTFKVEGLKMTMNFLNTNKELVNVSVYDANESEVYKATFRDFIVEEAFNFESAAANTYTVEVRTNGHTYYKNIEVKK